MAKPKRTAKKSLLTPNPLASHGDTEVNVQPELTVYFGYCLYKAALRLRAALDKKLAPHNLIAPQLSILRSLNDTPRSQVEICRGLGVDGASLVKLIDLLEDAKLVTRTPSAEDRRANRVALTPKGRQVFQRASKLRIEVEDEFLSPLSASEQAVLRKAIPKLLR